MLKPFLLSALLLFTSPLARAEDPVLFFDGPAHGWKVKDSYLAYNRTNDIVFISRANKNRNYVYNLMNKKINFVDQKGLFEIGDIPTLRRMDDFGPRAGFLFIKEIRSIDISNGSFFYDLIEYENEEENIDQDRYFISPKDYTLVFLIGKKYHSHESDYNKNSQFNYFYKTNIDYNFISYASQYFEERAVYFVSSGKNGFFYKIPEEKLQLAIVRKHLLYIPVKFMRKVWDATPECPERTNDAINKLGTPKAQTQAIQACLDKILYLLPKGDYDADSPYPNLIKR